MSVTQEQLVDASGSSSIEIICDLRCLGSSACRTRSLRHRYRARTERRRRCAHHHRMDQPPLSPYWAIAGVSLRCLTFLSVSGRRFRLFSLNRRCWFAGVSIATNPLRRALLLFDGEGSRKKKARETFVLAGLSLDGD